MPIIAHTILINADVERVYGLLSTADGIAKWFTTAHYSENTQIGDLELLLWGNTRFRVTDHSPGSRVAWHCISVDNPWYGTDIVFELRPDAGTALLLFEHQNWPAETQHFRECSESWEYFLQSLKSLLETGVGTPEDVAPPYESPK